MYILGKEKLGSGIEPTPVFKRITGIRNEIKEVVDLRARSHSAKFPICEKD